MIMFCHLTKKEKKKIPAKNKDNIIVKNRKIYSNTKFKPISRKKHLNHLLQPIGYKYELYISPNGKI